MSKKFQIVVSMSGFGERFRRAGYKLPKPLIEVEGKPIIEHVVEMFDKTCEFIFICNREHLEEPEFQMEDILKRIAPNGKIIAIEPHKLGPVYAFTKAEEYIDKNLPTIINYCDFTCYWSFEHFKEYVLKTECDGSIPCYTGFHPHMLGSVNYAYVKCNGTKILDIQEKQPYTNNPQSEYASSGTYYFKSGALALEYAHKTIEQDINLNGEYYASLMYKPALAEGKNIEVYEIMHFMQWGTPQDLAEYNYYSNMFRSLLKNKVNQQKYPGYNIMPMAGAGSRFAKEGYELPKPLIEVSGKPMVVQATSDMPNHEKNIFILREDLPNLSEIMDGLKENFVEFETVTLQELTEGQAITSLEGAKNISDEGAPITIAACDNGMAYDENSFDKLFNDDDVDIIVWVKRGHPNGVKAPQMYGWVDADELGNINKVSVKKPLLNPESDPIITGTFTFKKASHFKLAVANMVEQNKRINGEFYIDECINNAVKLGLKCKIFEIDAYLCFGTPNELKTFEYWQSCFHKWKSHDYSLEKDERVNKNKLDALQKKYSLRIIP